MGSFSDFLRGSHANAVGQYRLDVLCDNEVAVAAGRKNFGEHKYLGSFEYNYPTANQNVGAAQMGIKKYADAHTAFHAELKLVDCLAGLGDSQLGEFGYFVEVAEQDPVKRRQAQSEKLKAELPKVKAATHYNLACNYSLQKQKDGALTELKAAIDAGFSGKQALNTDPDLAFVRQTLEFRELVGRVK